MSTSVNSKTKWGGPVWGAAFTVAWVICVGTLFALLLGTFDGTARDVDDIRAAAAGLIWPFVALALGVPLIVFIWFGGYEAIFRLADLRRHLDRIGQYANDFEEMNEKAATLKSHMDGASESVAKASNSISSNFEDFETKISPKIDIFISKLKVAIEPGEAVFLELPTNSEAASSEEANFDDLHSLANDIFYEALDNRNAAPGRGRNQLVVSKGGWDKSRIVEKLLSEKCFEEHTAKTLSRVFELEASTRRWGRDKIDRFEIQALYKELQNVWHDYLRSMA